MYLFGFEIGIDLIQFNIILYEYLCAYINIYKNHNKIFLAQFLSIIFTLLIESSDNEKYFGLFFKLKPKEKY